MLILDSLDRLEAEAIFIFRECVSQAEAPVILFSAGKDSTVLGHLAAKAFYPSRPPLSLLHIDSTWEFRELLDFRNEFAQKYRFNLIVHANEEGRKAGINPFDHGERYTRIMRTDALREALDAGKYDFIFGGARRDEERSRAKERIISIRNQHHGWDPRYQRPEFNKLFNLQLSDRNSARVFPLSNWTEEDILKYIEKENIEICPLYYSAQRPTVKRGESYIVVDDPARMRQEKGDAIETRSVRFRTLGCWPVTGAILSEAGDISSIIEENKLSRISERQGRIADNEDGGSLEDKKREGYF
jgi:sulfate adenylyltransferase subunit 2